jgi:hypothetical protein
MVPHTTLLISLLLIIRKSNLGCIGINFQAAKRAGATTLTSAYKDEACVCNEGDFNVRHCGGGDIFSSNRLGLGVDLPPQGVELTVRRHSRHHSALSPQCDAASTVSCKGVTRAQAIQDFHLASYQYHEICRTERIPVRTHRIREVHVLQLLPGRRKGRLDFLHRDVREGARCHSGSFPALRRTFFLFRLIRLANLGFRVIREQRRSIRAQGSNAAATAAILL